MKTLAQLNQYAASSVTFTDESLGVGQVLANRYQINGLLDTANPVMENIERMCSAAGSWLSYDIHAGKWGVVINQTGTSIASFSDNNILGNISISGTGLTDFYNSVKVEFPHRELRDSADYVRIEIPSGDRNANEPDNTLNISYDVINDPVQANLLGFIELKQSRVDLVIDFQTDYSYINVKAGDIIDVTNVTLGFASKLFRVVTVKEAQDDSGLILSITAIEYDADVYSTADLYRYTRSDENGIITIGSIGIPGTPQVTKYEVDARPRVIIESTAPTGVVEGLEYWLSNDFNEADDANRSYTLIATKRPTGGGIYSSGSTVSLDYDQLNTSNFYVKTRGFNATTVGPFSTPSGLVEFTATQVTNAVGPDTKAIDSLGGILTALAVIDLLKGVDDVYKKVSGNGGMFDKIWELYGDITGTNPVANIPKVNSVNPSSGPIEGGTNVTILGSNLTNATSVTFDGTAVTNLVVVNSGTITATTPANAVGPASVIVTTPVGSNGSNSLYTYTTTPAILPIITGASPSVGPRAGGTPVTLTGSHLSTATSVTFDGIAATALVVVNDTTITVVTPPGEAGPANIGITTPLGSNIVANLFSYVAPVCSIAITAKYPPDRATYQDPTTGATSDTAPITGSYFIKYGNQTFYKELSKGSGNVSLYKSDGTLVEVIQASNVIIHNNVVEIPFSNREAGTDYYILMDEGVVNYCGCVNPPIVDPTTWNFNTPFFSATPFNIPGDAITPLPESPPTIVNRSPTGSNACINHDIIFEYNKPIIKGSGNAYLKNYATDAVVGTIAASATTVTGSTLNMGPIQNLGGTYSTQYYIEMDAGFVKSYNVVDCLTTTTNNAAIVKSSNINFTTTNELQVIGFSVASYPLSDTSNTKVNPNTNIGIVFNKPVYFGNTGLVKIYANGATHQEIDVNTSFNVNKTSELIWIAPLNTTTTVANTVWINPTRDLPTGATCYVLINANSITDSCNQTWGGITSPSTVSFTVDTGPTSTVSSFGNSSTALELNFDRDVVPGTGMVKIYDANNNLIAEVASDDPAVTIS